MPRIATPAVTLLSLACGVFLSACATPIGYASGTSVTERDTLHRSTPAPTVEPEAPFIAHTVETDIAAPPEVLLPWLVNVPLERILLGTEKLAGIERTDVLSASWGSPGARRRVVLRDGNTSLEELLVVEEGRRFQYVVWNFTNEARRAVQYAVGEFRFAPTATGTHLTWTYRFRGNGWPTEGILKDFVEEDFAAYMKVGIGHIQKESTLDLTARRD
ncbi:SRPBCC family protein [Myxococcus sp. CA051A]|uniref:SRPBCC family protein n=1 Tax=unclassified Myxococcus TaxID=2648731 RepID=UPI00157A5460|nr:MULTISPECIES: SRPBCC family protein [unclassified Myxococcus]NTX12260.1 SRPBCC family protein [Myxococcus sp. CA056]NTX33277.1 SRPBCC family protein [Myxococcus sp. CA033]NTX50241.1 SRPBCC family protein [Myxococcus sp. CA039A]NTX59659.1 SRPBCC family protein [Myxococcus sp. CA051A]